MCYKDGENPIISEDSIKSEEDSDDSSINQTLKGKKVKAIRKNKSTDNNKHTLQDVIEDLNEDNHTLTLRQKSNSTKTNNLKSLSTTSNKI